MTGRIPRQFIDELINRIDIVEIIDARVPLRKAGKNYSACCPFHNEKTPSFSVSPDKQFYYCFGCGAHGNAVGFLMEYDRMSFVEAVESLASQLGLSVPQEQGYTPQQDNRDLYQLMQQIAVYYQQQLKKHAQGQQAIDYLKQRGLTGEIVKEFAVGFAPQGWDNVLKSFAKDNFQQQQLLQAGLLIKNDQGRYYDRFRERIMFPIRDRRGRVVGFGGRTLGDGKPKYLNSPETVLFHKGSELYGMYEVLQKHRDIEHLLLVEGYMDVVALAQFGIDYAVASLGTALTEKHLRRVFKHSKELICCFDGDEAGQQAAKRALHIILPLLQDDWQIRFMFLPQGEDPDSLVRKEGQQVFEQRINDADTISEYLFADLCKDLDLSKADARALLAKRAMPLIESIPGQYLQTLLLDSLAQKIKLDVKKISKFLTKDFTVEMKPNIEEDAAMMRKTPIRLAISLLLQYPTLADKTIDIAELQQLQLPGIELLTRLIQLLQQNSGMTMANIIEHWRDTPYAKQLAKLAANTYLLKVENAELEFKAVLQQLGNMERDHKLDELMSKANQHALSQEEKQQLKTLLSMKK